jgi:hypothetical protein
MRVRIVSPGWETFTGSLGFRAVFENGESVGPLDRRQIARIGSSIQIVDIETGLQVGPSVVAASMKFNEAPVAEPLIEQSVVDRAEADERERLAKEAEARKAEEAKALEAAKAKAAEEAASVVYTRQELEAIGANDGIAGLRVIAEPLKVKGRGIAELVTEILAAQAKLAAA